MGVNFPSGPTVGQLYPDPAVAGLPQYVWDGVAWVGIGGGASGGSGSANMVFATVPFLVDNRALRSDGTGRGSQPTGILIDDHDHVGVGTPTPTLPNNSIGDLNRRYFTIAGDALGPNIFPWLSLGGNITDITTNVGNLVFYNSAIAAVERRIAQIVGGPDGAIDSGKITFQTFKAGVSQTAMMLSKDAYVGIGTVSPTSRLHVEGNVLVRTAANERLGIDASSISGGITIQAYNDAVTANIPIEVRGNPTVFTTGSVGIGTASPIERLHVNGNAIVTGTVFANGEVKTGWGSASGVIRFGSDSNYIYYDGAKFNVSKQLVVAQPWSVFGAAGGNASAPVRETTNVLLYDYGADSWCGIGSGTDGAIYFRTGYTAGLPWRMLITPDGQTLAHDDPTQPQGIATKRWVDNTKVDKSGGSMSGALINTSGNLTAYGWSSNNNSGVLFLNAANDRYLYYSGSAYYMPGAQLVLGADPSDSMAAATKQYVDGRTGLKNTPSAFGWISGSAVASINALLGAGYKDIVFPKGTYVIDANLTIGVDTSITIWDAIIQVQPGVTLWIYGDVIATNRLIFTGGGLVRGIARVRPEWWPSASGNDSPAWQAAIDCAESLTSGEAILEMQLSARNYQLSSTVIFHLAPYLSWRLRGTGPYGGQGGSFIVTNAGFSGSIGIWFVPIPQGDGTWCAANAIIENIAMRPSTANAAPDVGLQIGSNAVHLNSTIAPWIRVDNCYIGGFWADFMCWRVRGVLFENCVSDYSADDGSSRRGGTNFMITAPANGNCGEIHLTNCQAKRDMDGNAGCVKIHDFGRTNVNLSGIGISGIDCYAEDGSTGNYVHIYAQGSGSNHGDIWITGSRNQFEGVGNTCNLLDIRAENAATIADIHVENIYGTGWGFRKHVKASTGPGGSIFDLFINDNWFVAPAEEAVYINGAGGTLYAVTVADNHIRSPSGLGPDSCAMLFQNTTNVNIHDNQGTLPSRVYGGFVKVINSNWVFAHHNNSGGNVLSSIVTGGNGAQCFFDNNY